MHPEIIGRQMRRLHERGPGSRGLTVDRDGVALGPDCLLVRRTQAGYRCADLAAIRMILEAAYGSDRHAPAVFAGICRIAEALKKQELALAQIRGLYLPLPDLDSDALRGIARTAPLVKANFNPAELRVPAHSPGAGEWTDDGSPAAVQAHLVEAGYTLAPEMWRLLRELYRLFMSSGGDIGALRDYLAERGLQLSELPNAIRTLFDPPHPLAELQTTKPAMGFDTETELRAYLGPAPPGYEWHHLIEQTGQFRPDLTSPQGVRTWIQNTGNMVLVPVIKHYCISGLMSTRMGPGVRMRDFVKAHAPAFQREIGIGLLQTCKVIQ